MKKLLSVLLTVCLLIAVGAASAEDAGIEKGTIVYGSNTELSGDWGREMWTNNAADKMVRELMDDYNTVVSNQGGEYVVNPTVAKSVEGVMNDDGTKTYTVTIQDGLVYNNGDPITAKDIKFDVESFKLMSAGELQLNRIREVMEQAQCDMVGILSTMDFGEEF